MIVNNGPEEIALRDEVWEVLLILMAAVDKDVFIEEVRTTLKGTFLKAMGTEYAKILTFFLGILDAWSIDRSGGIHLDRIGDDYDCPRGTDDSTGTLEDDEVYRDRLKMHLFIQNSEGIVPHIRTITRWILNHFGATLQDPADDYDFDNYRTGLTNPHMSLKLEEHTGTRELTDADINVFWGEIPLERFNHLTEGLNHPIYGNLSSALIVEVHWDAIQVRHRHDALMIMHDSHPDLLQHGIGPGRLRWLDYPLREIINFVDMVKAGGIQLIFRGIGGFTIHSPTGDQDKDDINAAHHGVGFPGSRLTGDLKVQLKRLQVINNANA